MQRTTFVDVLEHHAQTNPQRIALSYLANGEDISEQLTYFELTLKIKQLAAEIQTHALFGERAVLLSSGGIDFIISLLACIYAGVIPVPAYPPASSHHLKRLQSIVDDAKPKLIILNNQIISRLERLSFPFGTMTLINLDKPKHVAKWQYPEIDDHSLVLLQYTSGSCGDPKGVMLSHANLLAQLEMLKEAVRDAPPQHFLGWIPLFHDMGLIGKVFQPLYLGIDSILMPPAKFIQKPVRWLSAISRYKATHSAAPDFAYRLCVQKITEEQKLGLDLKSWLVAYNGAEPVRASTITSFINAFSSYGFTPKTFFPCYGLAEAILIVSGGKARTGATFLTVDETALMNNTVQLNNIQTPHELVASGEPCINQEIKIVDPETMKSCTPNKIGEIWLNGPHVGCGYWHNDSATQQTFAAYTEEPTQGPFLRTGDLGFMHQGLLYITGRLKDVVIIRGKLHYPQDIEYTAENSYPELCNPGAVVFSITENHEEKLIVVQELSKRITYEPQRVISAIQTAIIEQHGIIPAEILLIRERGIPRTSSGKVQRQLSKQWYLMRGFPESD